MYAVVFITVGGKDEAQKIAHELVNEGLAACVNIIGGVESVYFWKGKTEVAEEQLLFVKTTKERLDSLVRRVKEMHSYSVPEIIWIDLDGGLKEYLEWLKSSTHKV